MADHTRRVWPNCETFFSKNIRAPGSEDGLLVGLQLTHSGDSASRMQTDRLEPRILYHHPILDGKVGLSSDYPLLTDTEITKIIERFHSAAKMAWELGFDFVDIKHCHGYLGPRISERAHTRRKLRGVSRIAHDSCGRWLRVDSGQCSRVCTLRCDFRIRPHSIPARFRTVSEWKIGLGDSRTVWRPDSLQWGFGVNPNDPHANGFDEAIEFLSLLEKLAIRLVNLTAGSPYYNPHIQRPALYSAIGRISAA